MEMAKTSVMELTLMEMGKLRGKYSLTHPGKKLTLLYDKCKSIFDSLLKANWNIHYELWGEIFDAW